MIRVLGNSMDVPSSPQHEPRQWEPGKGFMLNFHSQPAIQHSHTTINCSIFHQREKTVNIWRLLKRYGFPITADATACLHTWLRGSLKLHPPIQGILISTAAVDHKRG